MGGGVPSCPQKLLNLSTCFCRVIALAEVERNTMESIGVNDSEVVYGRSRVEALIIWRVS